MFNVSKLEFHNKKIAEVALGGKCPEKGEPLSYVMTSPVGHIYTNVCKRGVHCVMLYGDANFDNIDWSTGVHFVEDYCSQPINKHAKKVRKWLRVYFLNPLKTEKVEVPFCGLEDYGEFNSKIWMTIIDTCPPGDLMSYSELAQRAGYSAGASKVVGYAINKNPYLVLIGDHRVVKASGEVWCVNGSPRNRLRRLLVDYEASYVNGLNTALAEVKERNESTKHTRRRAPKDASTSEKKKAAPKRKRKRGDRDHLSDGSSSDEKEYTEL